MILVTGGAGFIGSNFILNWLQAPGAEPVVNLDKLTYAGNLQNLAELEGDQRYVFVRGDIGDAQLIERIFKQYQPRAVVNFAAESHVDRSITGPQDFVKTNLLGTFVLLEGARKYFEQLGKDARQNFRFLHVSTDEVFGSLDWEDPAFTEATPYQPNSPYSASKAGSDHLVRAYFHTYGLPTLTTNCSNNYGPYQFPEKLIPLMIHNALQGRELPIYGDGKNIRDWLYVVDHCRALETVLVKGQAGQTYNIGGDQEKNNLTVVQTICDLLQELRPIASSRLKIKSYKDLITYVKDRPGHDRRYAMDATKLKQELDWQPQENFESGLRKTVQWYLDHQDWVTNITSGDYKNWIEKNYAERV